MTVIPGFSAPGTSRSSNSGSDEEMPERMPLEGMAKCRPMARHSWGRGRPLGQAHPMATALPMATAIPMLLLLLLLPLSSSLPPASGQSNALAANLSREEEIVRLLNAPNASAYIFPASSQLADDLHANFSSSTALPLQPNGTSDGPNGSTWPTLEPAQSNGTGEMGGRHFQLVSFNWAHVHVPLSLSLWLLLASIAKILFNLDKRLPEAIPDSALLIVLGLVLGLVLQVLDVDSRLFTLPSSTFFLYLLPPIIFDAGYFMPNRQLFENFDSVLLFAFCGTIWNTLAIGFSLLWLSHLCLFSVPFSAFQILLFASLISAVDPVAVIAVFEEIHINEFLFINVFGEALFNDGVSVVLYQMFRKFILIGEDNLLPIDFLAGIGSFLVIALGGVCIGIFFALLASLATKYTTRVRILAPVFIFVVPYVSYLTAEMFGLSSILAIVACGIGMKQYVKGNLSHDAASSVKYFVKMLSQCSETVIFMFLGLSTVSHGHHWDWAFVGATVGLCLLHRVIGVVVQCAVLNRFRTKKFSLTDQFVLSYGGLRGAIAFGLVVSLDDNFEAKRMFLTTCIAVIFFTVFVQGITIRPLLYWLKVEKQEVDKQETMIEKIYSRYCDYMMAGLEDISGQKGKNSFRDTFERFNARVIRPVLMRNEKCKQFDTSSILRAYKKITLLEAHRLARTSIRIKRPPTARVAPAHSPSSASSTLNYSHCWTTTTTVANGHAGSGGHTPLSNGKGPVRLRIGSEESGGPLERPASAHSTQHSGGEERVNPVELEQYLAQPENTEVLYAMFSRLLDRKMTELRVARKSALDEEEEAADEGHEDDIQDNYLDAFGAIKRRKAAADLLWATPRGNGSELKGGQQRKQSDERRRFSLSPAMERQIGSMTGPVLSKKVHGVIAARGLLDPSREEGQERKGEGEKQRMDVAKQQMRRDIP